VLEFADIDDIGQQGPETMDLDNVIMTDTQRADLHKQMIRSKQFWVLFAMQGLSILFAYYTVDVYKSFGLDVPAINDDKFLTTVGSVSSLFDAARFLWSGSLDKISFRFVYGFLLILQICIAFTIHITSQNKTSYFIVICLELWCVGGHFALFPNVIR